MTIRERQTTTARVRREAGARSPTLLLACLVVFLVAAALYLPAVWHDFVWDDLSILMTNPLLDDWSKLGSNLTSDFFNESSDARPFDYWRPLVVLSHMVDRSLFGSAAWGPHLVNVLLHAMASVLVLLLAHSWMRHLGCALVAGLAFATHPVHVEVVAWVSGRSDLLFGASFSLALLADRLYAVSGRARWLVVSLASFVAALSSKEAAVVFPVLVAGRAFLTNGSLESGGRSRRVLTAPLPSLVALAFFWWIRFGLVDVALPMGVSDATHRAAAFWTWWSAFLRYMELLVLPLKLTILHDLELATEWWSPRVLAGLLLFVTLGWGGWRLRATQGAAFGVMTLLVCFAPLSSFLLPVSGQGGTDFPFAERFLYVPSIGFCIVAAWILASWLPGLLRSAPRAPEVEGEASDAYSGRREALVRKSSVSRLLGLLSFLLIVAAATRTHFRVGDWASEVSLFSTAVRASPGSYLAHLNYASALASVADQEAEPETKRDKLEVARRHYLEALEIAPGNYRIHYDLGNLYRALGRLNEAEAAYRQALYLHSRLPQARINLGTILVLSGDLEGALTQFEAAQDLLPRAAAPRVNRGHVLQMLGRPEDAIPLYRQALALEPGLGAAVQGLVRARKAVAPVGDDRDDSR